MPTKKIFFGTVALDPQNHVVATMLKRTAVDEILNSADRHR